MKAFKPQKSVNTIYRLLKKVRVDITAKADKYGYDADKTKANLQNAINALCELGCNLEVYEE